jgi:hypothetical protein
MAKRVNATEAIEKISRREAFVSHGAISARGHTGPGDHLLFGRAREGSAAGNVFKNVHDADYVVMSYQTPIGVHSPTHGWVIPDVKYSTSTSKHQTYTRRGAEASGRPVVKDTGPKPSA